MRLVRTSSDNALNYLRERDHFAKIFDKALQSRNQPRDRWPKKIMGQSVNLRLMNTVEDFYDLDQTLDVEDQHEDYFEDYSESGLSAETAALFEESLQDNSSVTMKSVKVKNFRVDCGCNCRCHEADKRETEGITNRRVCVSASPAFPVEIANDKGSRKDDLVCDSGCTAECIVNKDFADSLGLTLHPTNIRSATLGDGETDMTILG